MTRQITIEARVSSPPDVAWRAFTTPEAITEWNFASADWWCPSAQVNLREGARPPRDTSALALQDELVEALDADPELSEAFHRLTRGRQKSHVINLNGAKKSETRIVRIAKFRNRIIEGKGANER